MRWTKEYKIAILNHNQRFFGTYFRCFNIAKYLSENGASVDLITVNEKVFDPFIRIEIISDRLRVISLPRFKYGKYSSGQILRLFLTFLILLFRRYSLVYAFSAALPQISLPAITIKYLYKSKLYFDWDDLWGGGFSNSHNWLISKILTWHETAFLKNADGISYVSKYLGELLNSLSLNTTPMIKIENGCTLTNYVPISIYEARKRRSIDQNKKILVCVGNTYTEGINDLFEAIKVILKDSNDIEFYFVGSELSEMPKVFPNDKLPSNVIFTGKKIFKIALEYMYAADCLLLPMGNNNIENARFPMRFADYIAVGRPIVSNAVGEVKDFLNNYNAGLVVKQGSPSDFIDKIRMVLEDKKLCEILVKNQINLSMTNLNNQYILNKLDNFLK